MRYIEFRILKELKSDADQIAFDTLKNQLINQINNLRSGPESIEFLKQIQDTLKSTGAATRVVGVLNAKSVKGKLSKIRDKEMTEEIEDLLTRWILSVDAPTSDKRQFLALLAADKLINKKELFRDGVLNNIKQSVVGYGKNQATTKIVDGIARHVGQGIGPGEILMVTLSSGITKLTTGGDLRVNHPVDGEVELKTSRAGSPRFNDRKVKPKPEYGTQSQNFISNYITPVKLTPKSSGVSTKMLTQAYGLTPPEKREVFKKDLNSILLSVYPYAKSESLGAVINGISSDNESEARQAIGKATFENYKSQKQFEGVLYMNIENGNTLYYNDWEDLSRAGVYALVKTVYLVGGGVEGPYPQIELVAK